MTSDVRMQDFLDAFTDAVLGADADPRSLAEAYDVPYDDAIRLASVVEGLHRTLLPIEPAPTFALSLKRELMGKRPGVVLQWRRLPARVQMAAALAVFGGFMFILRQRFGQSMNEGTDEAPAMR